MYQARLVDGLLRQYMADFPALLITGPRATGKTTTAARHARSVVRLDRKADAEAYRADPDSVLARQSEPVLLDEWQAVPEVLGAVKRSVDQDPRPGRFVLTGSVRAMLSAETSKSATSSTVAGTRTSRRSRTAAGANPGLLAFTHREKLSAETQTIHQ